VPEDPAPTVVSRCKRGRRSGTAMPLRRRSSRLFDARGRARLYSGTPAGGGDHHLAAVDGYWPILMP